MRGNGPFTFSWFKDGNPMKKSSSVSIISSNKISNLIIEPVEENSAGNYTCILHSKDGQDEFTAYLKVRAPPTWVKEPQDVETLEGSTASLFCFANGSSLPTITWRKLDTQDYQKPKAFQKISTNGTLMFQFVSKLDDGSYECEVENGIGESLRKTAVLVVHGRL
ncbi:Down syndrome cell adhesion molecule-like protein Dscam2 isoform X2 [Stegodyphus dumicola]|nr:Down syndrome cell adhesion molecule-like protein Dscam2 isoform X2 [Stegodyphus dumicola]